VGDLFLESDVTDNAPLLSTLTISVSKSIIEIVSGKKTVLEIGRASCRERV
jgi:hypothetical protein